MSNEIETFLINFLDILKPNAKYLCIKQDGPQHALIFTMSLIIDNKKYFGTGRNKREAKKNAAIEAVRNFSNSDQLEKELKKRMDNLLLSLPARGLLNRLGLNEQYILEAEDNDQFTYSITLDNMKWQSNGSSKIEARENVAKKVLSGLITRTIIKEIKKTKPSIKEISSNIKNEFSQSYADLIEKLVINKYTELRKHSDNDLDTNWKALAGILIERNDDPSTLQVIALATGSKTIDGSYLSLTGQVINDSHAEILAKRCLVSLFYNELLILIKKVDSKHKMDIFEEPNSPNELYRLKDGIKFHMYISMPPCGASSIINIRNPIQSKDHLLPNRCVLRAKIECSMGTIALNQNNGIQTWDGIVQGQTLNIMSCSDKITRWNVLGLQGALLATIVKPIYLTSIISGSFMDMEQISKSCSDRIKMNLRSNRLPSDYQLNSLKFGLGTQLLGRNIKKASQWAYNWHAGDDHVEIINPQTGKRKNDRNSRLTKRSMFSMYDQLRRTMYKPLSKNCTYAAAKAKSVHYQKAKCELYSAFESSELGNWFGLPVEQDQFLL